MAIWSISIIFESSPDFDLFIRLLINLHLHPLKVYLTLQNIYLLKIFTSIPLESLVVEFKL